MLIAVVILCTLCTIALVIMAILYATRDIEQITHRDFNDVVLELGVDDNILYLTLSFTDTVTPRPAYYLIVFRVNTSQFVTRELLPSDSVHRERVAVSYLVAPSLFEAQITRIESNGMRVESPISHLYPDQVIEAMKPKIFSRTLTMQSGIMPTSIATNTKTKIHKIMDIATNELEKRDTPSFHVAVTTKSILVFMSKSSKEWYEVTDEEVQHWNVSNSRDLVVFSNSDGIVFMLNLETFEFETTIKLDEENMIAIGLVDEDHMLTLTNDNTVMFTRSNGVWTRLLEMSGNGFTGIEVNRITTDVYSVILIQCTNKSTKFVVNVTNKTIIKHNEEDYDHLDLVCDLVCEAI